MKKILPFLLALVLLAIPALAAESVPLSAFPESRLISVPIDKTVALPTGAPIGITGDKGAIAATVSTAKVLTDAEKADVADIGYGVSAIGVSEFGKANAVQNLVNGHWGSSYMANLLFDGNMYAIDGTVSDGGKYRALITLNFGETQVFDAIGFFSGNSEGCPQIADVYVSADGETWTLVPSASWDAVNGDAFTDIITTDSPCPADLYTGNTNAAFAALFDMGGVTGKYIRIGVVHGTKADPTKINTRELAVYGNKPANEEPINILFIGNSHTYVNDMPETIFAPICEAAGYNVNVKRITCGGYYLYQHSNINNDYGAQVHAAIKSGDYDIVVIQEQSSNPGINRPSFNTSVRRLVTMIRESGATPYLYCTWGHRDGSATLTNNGWTTETMTYDVVAGYTAIGEELGVTVSYAGWAYYDVFTNHADKIDLYNKDNYHPSKSGSYLAALTHFATIFGDDPRAVNYNAGQGVRNAEILKKAAYNATYNTPEIPEAHKVSSVGVGESGFYGVDTSKTKLLTALPTAPMISVPQDGDGFSGILGDKGVSASAEYSVTGLTDAQKADIADIGYGVSMIGVESMIEGSNTGYKKAIGNLVNGHWGYTLMSCLNFDDAKYDIDGTANADGKYTALITLNFGGLRRFDALGFFSGDQNGFPAVADVYVSEDGKNWTIVPTACYDGINSTAYVSLGTTPEDPYNGNTSAYSVLFDMDGAVGKYVRLGVAVGRANSYANYNSINTRELVVYGGIAPFGDVDASGVTDVADVLYLLQSYLNGETASLQDINCDGSVSLLDVLVTLKAIVG